MDHATTTTPERPRSRNRRGQGARLREELIAAAHRLLEQTGSENAVSIRAVAREAGIAPQSVYLHFASLDDLLYAVYQEQHAQMRITLESAAADQPNPAARLAAVARAYCAFGLERPGAYRVLMSSHGRPHPDWQELGMPGAPTFELLRTLLADVGHEDTVTTAACLWATLHGLVTLRLDRPAFPWPDLDTLIDRAVRDLTVAQGMS